LQPRYTIAMRRWLVVAALGAVFLALPAWGQRRGGGSMGFAGHVGFSGSRSPMSAGGQHWAITYGRPVPARGPIITNGPYYFHHFGYYGRRRYGSYPWWGYGGWYPGWGWGWDWDNDYSQPQQTYNPGYDTAAYYAQSAMQSQQDQINQLQDEIDRLRQERQQTNHGPASSSQTRANVEAQPTQLIFKDKHTEQVQNYAIVGKTFWILNDQRARKIALADLDLPATQEANEARGIDFELPR
jgi:hypothetical protein